MENSKRTLIRILPKARRGGRRRELRLKTITMRIQRSCWTTCCRSPGGWARHLPLVLTTLCIALAILVLMLLTTDTMPGPTKRLMYQMDKWEGRFEIDLPGCRLPQLDPHDEVILKDWFQGDQTSCKPQERYFLSAETRNNETCLKVHEDILLLDYGLLPDRIKCTYQVIEASFDKDPWMNLYSYDTARNLDMAECFSEPYIWVQCDLPNRKPYKQALFIAKEVPPSLKYISVNSPSPPVAKKNLNSKRKLNVLVLGVDAVSRVMFHRLMGSTYKKLQQLYGKNMFELKLFNKVGANSAPNQIPMLTGKRFRHEEHMNHGEYFEEFGPYVWDDFSNAGYTTLFIEEQMRYGLFSYPSRRGFRDIPTDYWPRPLTIILDEYRRSQPVWTSCVGNEYISTTLLKYWLDLQEVSSSPTFSYIWLSEVTHDSVTGAKSADVVTSQFFDSLEKANLTENTFVILLADHGYRIAPFRETPLGTLEDMLPFAFLLLPRSYRLTNPQDIKHLKENENRLTTPYDIHATLKDLAARSRGQRVEKTEMGQSLLSSRISRERTCDSAGIDPPYCSCYVPTALDESELPSANEMAEEVIGTVNDVLQRSDTSRKCLTFSLFDLKIEELYGMGLLGNESEFKFFRMKVKVDRGPVTFEASFKVVDGVPLLIGIPERLDRYDIFSYCVRETFYEKFCYCK